MAKKAEKMASALPKFGKVPKGLEERGARKEGGYEKLTPEQRKARWMEEFDSGKNFFDAVKANADTYTNKAGEKLSAACIGMGDLQGFLGTKNKEPSTILGAMKRKLAMAGVVVRKGGARAITYDSGSDMMCIFPDRLENAPGKNIQTRVVYAKAATQGSEKFASLIKSFEKADLPVEASESDVKKWLTESGRFTGKKKPRGGKPAAVKKAKK